MLWPKLLCPCVFDTNAAHLDNPQSTDEMKKGWRKCFGGGIDFPSSFHLSRLKISLRLLSHKMSFLRSLETSYG